MVLVDTNPVIWGIDTRIAAVLVSLVSMAVAFVSITFSWQAKRLSERETAKSVYRKYLELALQNPEFCVRGITLKTFEGHTKTKYRLFISLLLHACEEILERDADTEWVATLEFQLERHTAYLTQVSAANCAQYDPRVRNLVRKIAGGNW